MKKYFFFALAAAGLLSSCSSDDTVAGTEVENEELVPIQIGFGGGSVSVEETRGTGTVGGYSTDVVNNKWHSQHFNLYMLKKGTVELAKFKLTPTSAEEDLFNNAEFIAPGTAFAGMGDNPVGPRVNGIARPLDNKIKYYPAQDNYDFYAYRVDDAAIGTPSFVADSLSIGIKINGSQDIMIAKAIPSVDEINVLKSINNNSANANRFYSSFSARHGVQPTLSFKHLLTRLTFDVVPKGGAKNPSSGIVLDSIKIVTDKTRGVLTIAKEGDNNGDSQKITWEVSSTPDTLALMQRDFVNHSEANIDSLDLVPFTSVDLRSLSEDTVSVGEALLVAPDTKYEIHIFGHQAISDVYGGSSTTEYKFHYVDDLKMPKNISKNPLFRMGGSYNVTIALWGVNQIDINTELSGWKGTNGLTITMEPEETKINGFAD